MTLISYKTRLVRLRADCKKNYIRNRRKRFMKIIDKMRFRNICLSAGIIIVFVITTVLVTNAQTETEKKPTTTTDANAKKEDYIEVVGKVLSIDPIKGDVNIRLEFEPHGSFTKEDGTLARNLKLDINSSNGKQEIVFEKGKRLTPTEAVLNMYDGTVTDYPFDKHEADLVFWFSVKPDKPAEKPKTAEENPASKPTDEKPVSETKPATAEADTEEVEVPISFEFAPSMPGFKIESAKSKDSDETYVDIGMKISRSPMVIFFSIFVMILMWSVSIAVLFLVLSVVVRGRKVEIAMFSFIATLLFAFVAVRNSQPGVPPIGTFTDYSSFFWAEVILALSLLTILFTWLLRPAAK
jgi:Domain of unknown function (DUF4436)